MCSNSEVVGSLKFFNMATIWGSHHSFHGLYIQSFKSPDLEFHKLGSRVYNLGSRVS